MRPKTSFLTKSGSVEDTNRILGEVDYLLRTSNQTSLKKFTILSLLKTNFSSFTSKVY